MKPGKKTAAAGFSVAVVSLAAMMIGPREGERLAAYRDVVGVPTICYGETLGVHMGQTATHAECSATLSRRVAQFAGEIAPCLPAGLPDRTAASFIDAAYNIGSAGFCASSMSRRALAGDLVGACNALLLWDKAGGRVVHGLTIRRQAERMDCLDGLAGK